MFETIRNAFKIAELRKKILFTIAMLLVFRFGSHIPVPGVLKDGFEQMLNNVGGLFNMLDVISGGSLKNSTIFAMSISPYINSSIIMQLLTVAIPALERLQKEGEEGRKKIQQYMRYGTVILAFFQASIMYISMSNTNSLISTGFVPYLLVVLSLTAGTAFLMWLGELMTEKGVGNGISLIIFCGIVSSLPNGIYALVSYFQSWASDYNYIFAALAIVGILLILLVVMVAVIWVNEGERRIPVQYAKRVVGRKMYGGQSTHIPIKVNLAGVIPIIFAMSIMMFPSTIVALLGGDTNSGWVKFFSDPGSGLGAVGYSLMYTVLIIFFTFFYSIIQFNPVEIANNLKKNGGFIPGVRPGKPTSDYVSKILSKVTMFGGIFLSVITIAPILIGALTGLNGIWFGGTSCLILVGVALETVKQIESMMLTRHYSGFLD